MPPKKPSLFALIGAGIVGLVIMVALMAGFYHEELPVLPEARQAAEPPPLEAPPEPDWIDQGGLNLPPLGTLPSLQSAARDNPLLRRALSEFAQKDDAELFANIARTDADIAAILLLWAGADLDAGGRSREGMDARVDMFLRRAFGLASGAPVIDNPRLGRDPWPRLFAHYKARLIAQAPGGAAPFTSTVRYDIGSDAIVLEGGGLNRRFFSDFGRFIRTQKNAAALRANLLAYIDMVDSSLKDRDARTLALIR